MNPQEYEKLAVVEDQMWYFRSLHAHFERVLNQALPAGRPARILDAGCGSGGLIRRLQPKHPDWTWQGLDISPEACDWARKRASAEVIQGSVEQLPLESGSLDAVVSADVLCQVDNPARAVSEFMRVLRPGGALVLNLPACKGLWSYHDECVGNRRRYSAKEARALMAEAGFRGIQVTHWNALLFPALYLKRRCFRSKVVESDVKPVAFPLELAFRSIMWLEHTWIGFDFTWPWGSSVFLVARKPLASSEERVVGSE